ncbi:MAG: hypothetical protein PVS3B3_27750 [Ktedonobacteraceae bacterium]
MQRETIVVSERMMSVVVLASLTAGIVAGIGARITMRIVALTSHTPPDFSIAGTLNILFNGIIFGTSVGFIVTMINAVLSASPKAGKYVPGPVWRGLIFGLLLLLVGFPILVSVDADDFALGIPLLNKIMFGVLFIIYGLTLGVAEKAFDHFLPRKPTSATTNILAPDLNEESYTP